MIKPAQCISLRDTVPATRARIVKNELGGGGQQHSRNQKAGGVGGVTME